MFDGVFFINSAIAVTHLSIYDTETRYKQTLETFKSIDKACPNNCKVIFDNSYIPMSEEQLKTIGNWPNTWLIQTGKHPDVEQCSLAGQRSLAETIAFIRVLDWFETTGIKGKRIYKLSGRYTLTDEFILDDPSYKDAFVFAEALPSWMPKDLQARSGVDNLYRLRLWHMDSNLFRTFKDKLPEIFSDCLNYGIDIEHGYYKHLHTNKVVEVKKIGVTGHIGPNGEFIDE